MLNGAEPDDRARRPTTPRRALRAALLAELGGTEHRLIELERPCAGPPRLRAGRPPTGARTPVLPELLQPRSSPTAGWRSSPQALNERGGRGRRRNRQLGEPGRVDSRQARVLALAARDAPACTTRLPALSQPPHPHHRVHARPRAAAGAGFERATDKRDTYLLESGPHSFTRQILARGLRPVVVGRDGRAYDIEEWSASATYRAEDQRNLLIADNRTRDWERASTRLRRRLSRDAWGSQASQGGLRNPLAADESRWPQATSTLWND